MSVRKTESLLPAGFTADDLGQKAISGTSPNVILISYLSSPVATRRIQQYVVFVIDQPLAATVHSYDWTFANGTNSNQTTSIGVAEFAPQNIGSLSITVNLKNAANTVLHSVSLTQQVISLNGALELMIEQTESNFPKAGDPETSRELLNDTRPYINAILPVASDDIFNRGVSSLVYANTRKQEQLRRNFFLNELANLLNTQPANFYSQAKDGFGLCKTRPQLLAMFLDNPATPGQKYLDIATLELPAVANATARTANATAIQTAFVGLHIDVQTGFFNLLRFPKSHLAMCKKIMEALQLRYFSASSIPAILGSETEAKKLMSAYEMGPKAFGAGGAFTATSFSGKVVKLFPHGVWAVPITAVSGAVAPPGAAVPAVAATVGIPEKLPTHTFVSHRDTEIGFPAGSLGYLRKAILYHDSYALSPIELLSFEELIDILSTSVAPIGRLRIVTHFGAPAAATALDSIGVMFLPFFTGQTRNDSSAADHKCYSEHFKYGVSDVEGLLALFQRTTFSNLTADFLLGMQTNSSADTAQRELHDAILVFLQRGAHASLVPFNLQAAGSQPSSAVRVILKWAAGLFFLNNGTVNVEASQPRVVAATAVDASIVNAFKAVVQAKITTLITTTGVTTAANVNAIVTAFSSLSFAALGATSFHNSFSYIFSSLYLEDHSVLRTKLAIVKSRLDNSFVDIRGCRVGQDPTFMRALRSFFGNPGLEPTISAPEWFQLMGTIGSSENGGSLSSSETAMDAKFNSGISGTSIRSADVQREYSAWAGRIGINAQISFFTNIFNGSVFDLISLSWRTVLPPIGMESATLSAFLSQNFADAFGSIKKMFHKEQTVAPLAADLVNFENNFFPFIASTKTIEAACAALSDASAQPLLQAQLDSITTLAAAPLAAVLPAAPVPITAAHLIACLEIIKARLVTLSAVTPLVNSIKTKLADPKAGYRYMLDIGLGLIVQAASSEGDTRLLYYTGEKDNALKSFKKIQFEAPLPAATHSAIDALNPVGAVVLSTNGTADLNDDTYNDSGLGSMMSALASTRTSTQMAVAPSEEFHAHIKTEPV